MLRKLATGIALSMVSLTAIAEAKVGFYTGVGAGKVTLEDDVAGVHIKAEGSGLELFGGYRFNDYASIEFGYNDGTADDTVSGVHIESDAKAFVGSLLWHSPVGEHFEIYARGSLIAWEAEHTVTFGSLRGELETDGDDLGLGIGAAVHVTPKIGLRAEYFGSKLDGTKLRMLSITGLVRF